MIRMLEVIVIKKFLLIMVVYINGTMYTFETEADNFIQCKSLQSYQVILFNSKPNAVVVFSECKERIMA